jgi:hypothetical protein
MAANGLKDQLRQIVALATVDQWRATELSKAIKKPIPKPGADN